MRISDWSSDVCSSDLKQHGLSLDGTAPRSTQRYVADRISAASGDEDDSLVPDHGDRTRRHADGTGRGWAGQRHAGRAAGDDARRSEEHTSELQSLMRNSYAVFCLTTKKEHETINTN